MKFETVKYDTYRARNRIRGYINCLHARDNEYVDEEYAQQFYSILAEYFNTTPLVIMQSLSSVGLFDKDANVGKNKHRLLMHTLWRMCANKDVLKKNVAVLPYRQVSYPEDVYCRIIDVEASTDLKFYTVKAIVLTGHFAPNTITFKLSNDGIRLLQHRVGYDDRHYPTPSFMMCLIGVYVKLHLVPPTGSDNRIVDKILEDGALRTYNRKNILKYRCGNETCLRGSVSSSCATCVDGVDCPASYSKTQAEILFIGERDA